MGDKIYRTTISIPQGLKDRMDAVGEQVNWSAVAARAFEEKVLEISLREKRTMDKQDVIRRMQLAAEREEEEDRAAGLAAGREWAATQGPRALRRLKKWFEDFGSDWDRLDTLTGEDVFF